MALIPNLLELRKRDGLRMEEIGGKMRRCYEPEETLYELLQNLFTMLTSIAYL